MDKLCRIRDIYRSIIEFENAFEKQHGLSLNEGMLLCTLSGVESMSSTDLARELALSTSNTSKVIRSVELKGFIQRVMGCDDKRKMLFSLTQQGSDKLSGIKCAEYKLPDILNEIIE